MISPLLTPSSSLKFFCSHSIFCTEKVNAIFMSLSLRLPLHSPSFELSQHIRICQLFSSTDKLVRECVREGGRGWSIESFAVTVTFPFPSLGASSPQHCVSLMPSLDTARDAQELFQENGTPLHWSFARSFIVANTFSFYLRQLLVHRSLSKRRLVTTVITY